jgi:hypothetical protein
VNGVRHTEKNLYSYFAKTKEDKLHFLKQYPILKDEKSLQLFLSVVKNLRQQDWVETNRRKVDKLSNGKLAYVWLPNTGEGIHKFQPLLFCPKEQKKEPSLMSDLIMGTNCRLHHRCSSRELILIIPLGTNKHFTAPNAGI